MGGYYIERDWRRTRKCVVLRQRVADSVGEMVAFVREHVLCQGRLSAQLQQQCPQSGVSQQPIPVKHALTVLTYTPTTTIRSPL
jgi:hypothetical protein